MLNPVQDSAPVRVVAWLLKHRLRAPPDIRTRAFTQPPRSRCWLAVPSAFIARPLPTLLPSTPTPLSPEPYTATPALLEPETPTAAPWPLTPVPLPCGLEPRRPVPPP